MLLKIVILISSEPFLCLLTLSSNPISSHKKFTDSKIIRQWYLEKNQISKKETRSVKMLKTLQLSPSNCLITHCETLEEIIWQEKL